MIQGKVEICGVNTSKLPLLKNAEKEELFKRISDGDDDARKEYINGNLRLVLSVIKRFHSSNENVDDLFQIGCIGLIKAIDNFDSSLNVKFSTYAVPMIVGEIRRYLRDANSIRVSRSLKDTAYKAIYAKEHLTRINSKEPTVTEIAEEIGIPKEEIVYALDAIQVPMSLYEPVYTDGGNGEESGNMTLTVVRNVNVRDYPSTSDSNVLKVAKSGETYPCTGSVDDGQWYMILLEDGATGYVFHEYVTVE